MKQSLVSNQLLCLSRNKNKCWCLCKLSKTVYTQQSPWHIFLPVCLNNNLKIGPTQTLCCLHWVFFLKEKHNTFIFPFSKQYFMYFHHIQMQICFWIIQFPVDKNCIQNIPSTNSFDLLYYYSISTWTYYVFWELKTFQVLHIFVFCVDNLCEFLSFHQLFINVHLNFFLE